MSIVCDRKPKEKQHFEYVDVVVCLLLEDFEELVVKDFSLQILFLTWTKFSLIFAT